MMVGLGLIGCDKIIEVHTPVDQLVSSTIFQDSVTAQTAINGLYSAMYNSPGGTYSGFYKANSSILPGESADELAPQTSSLDDFFNNSLQPGNTNVTGIWGDSYNLIYIANSIIEGSQGSSTLTTTLKQQLTAEAKFIRAFCHFYLVNYFGKVPLITTTLVSSTNTAPATSADSVYLQIIKDLTEARDALATDYSWSGGDRTRVNSWTASAMLARVYLYTSQWALAEAEATKVIGNTGLYTLVTDPNQVFLANSQEAIWQFYTNVLGYTYMALETYPSGLSVPTYALNNILYNAFESGDLRKTDWIDSVAVSGTYYTFPYKYKANTNTGTEYAMVLRLGEQYLIRAEARAQQNNVAGAQADLDVIRTRATLPATTASDKASLLLAIEHERQVELFLEWGDRWLNLKRTARADAVLGMEKPAGWQATDTLYPIPQSAISTNPNLVQNNGYN